MERPRGRQRRARSTRITLALVAGALAAATIAPGVQATHSWGGYHWARTTNSFTLKIGDNVTATWDPFLATTISDWSSSAVIDLTRVTGGASSKQCRPTAGRVEVCNGAYGFNGWLGVAQIWLSAGHITQGSVKLNDSYFSTASYNSDAWRNLVMCQEVGHTFGLDHQDENFNNANLGTCMDYTNSPGTNQHPNKHDYDMLASIYGHTDTTNSYASTGFGGAFALVASAALGHEADPAWGELVSMSRDGHQSLYAHPTGPDAWVLTHVTWAEERVPAR